MDFRNTRHVISAHPVKRATSVSETYHRCAPSIHKQGITHYQVADILFDEVTKPSVDRTHLFNIQRQTSGRSQSARVIPLKPAPPFARSDEEFESYFVVDVS